VTVSAMIPDVMARLVGQGDPPDDLGLAADIAARIAQADADAIAWAYRHHGPAVRAFASRLVGDASIAEDLVHDVFVELPSAMRRFCGQASLRTFLMSIAVNHSRHHVRAASRRRAAMGRLSLVPPPSPVSPERDAQSAELARMLTQAMDQLTLEHRTTFVLCEVEEMSAHEAAEVLGIPAPTVRTRLFHAKRKLRDLLEKEEGR
jgi:RNA polymerase sigma-70 factor (ECF subfamily)